MYQLTFDRNGVTTLRFWCIHMETLREYPENTPDWRNALKRGAFVACPARGEPASVSWPEARN